jgi:anti-sigma B factor antagonist
VSALAANFESKTTCVFSHKDAQDEGWELMINFNSYQWEDADNVLVVELSGKLDTDSAETFFAQLEKEIESGHINLVFDCKELEFISSLGFGMMIRAHSRMQKANGVVKFARLEGFIAEAFHVVGFHKLFENYPTVEEAVKSFSE